MERASGRRILRQPQAATNSPCLLIGVATVQRQHREEVAPDARLPTFAQLWLGGWPTCTA
ncbi:hypothetical protein BH11GEM1_BH11GEM1_02790 [soil metagenome]